MCVYIYMCVCVCVSCFQKGSRKALFLMTVDRKAVVFAPLEHHTHTLKQMSF